MGSGDLSLEEVGQVDAEEEDEDESVELDDVDDVESLRLFFEDWKCVHEKIVDVSTELKISWAQVKAAG